MNPLPIKLGEIKEIDSIIADSTGRNLNHEENKKNINKSKLNEEGSNILVKDNNSSNDNTSGKNQNILPIKKKSSVFKNNFHEKNDIKEDDKEEDKNNSEKNNISNINKNNITKSNYSKKESKNKISTKNTPKLSLKNSKEKSNSKEVKMHSKISKKSNNQKMNQFYSNNSQSSNDLQNKENNIDNKNKLNLLISKDHSDILFDNNKDKDNILLENSLMNDSGSFGNYQNSNILENLSGQQKKQKDYLTNNKNKRKISDKENEKNNEESISLSTKNKKNKANKFKFDAYNNENNDSENKDSFSKEEISSLNEEDNCLIKKIKMIEEKEKQNISKNNLNIIGKNKKGNEIIYNNINLYMLNFNEATANSVKEPYTFNDTKGIFYEFFRKK